jgi:hypothetical protein
MELKRRGRRSAALVSSVLLVGAFVAYSTGIALFMGGSKSSSVFQTIPTAPTPPGAKRTEPNRDGSTPAVPGGLGE